MLGTRKSKQFVSEHRGKMRVSNGLCKKHLKNMASSIKSAEKVRAEVFELNVDTFMSKRAEPGVYFCHTSDIDEIETQTVDNPRVIGAYLKASYYYELYDNEKAKYINLKEFLSKYRKARKKFAGMPFIG